VMFYFTVKQLHNFLACASPGLMADIRFPSARE